LARIPRQQHFWARKSINKGAFISLEGRTGRTDRTGRTVYAGRIYYRPYSLINAGRTVIYLQRSELLIGLVVGLSRHHFRGLEKRERAKYTAGLFCTAVCNF